MYQVSEDRENFKEERNRENRYFQKKDNLYSRVRYIEIDKIIEIDWREVIAEYQSNRKVQIYSMFLLEVEVSNREDYPPFNK